MDDAKAAARVLVVDDDAMMRRMALRTLQHAGLDAHEAEDGEQALARLAAEPFALVLLDVVMPGLTGYEVCTRIRATPRGAGLPVIMLTGLNDVESIDRAWRAGATDFIAKPIHWTLLAQRVRYALRAAGAAEAAQRNGERLERAQRIAALGHWEMAADGRTLRCSPALAQLFGLAATTPGVSPESFLSRVHADDRAALRSARSAALADGTAYRLTYRIRRFDDDAERTVFEHAVPSLDAAGAAAGIEGITQDISERVEAERRLVHIARHDPVTGLANRAFFDELATPALERAHRGGDTCALLHLDVDRFRAVNAAVGRDEGDAMLRTMGQRLQDSVRSSDLTASLHGTDEPAVARVGANAFAVLLVGVGSDRQAAQVAARLQRAIALPLAIGGREVVLGASIGIAMFPRDAREVQTLARCAEQAADACKAHGGAQWRFFDEAMNAAAVLRLAREAELRQAIAHGELRLHYQPKFDAASRRIVGAEALVRWQHPQRGLLGPAEFIALAEETGLILPLTDWVLERACASQRARLDAGLPPIALSINLAPPSFADDALPDRLDALMREHALSPASLVLEVTETLLMRDPGAAARRLQQLRERGFRLSLDDFGTGYSSLGYLQQFAVDELKIDRRFVADVHGANHGAIARAVIALAREFRLDVVAEGVETAAQADFLVQHGCTLHQGYFYARPLPQETFDRLLVAADPAVAGSCGACSPA